MTSTTELAEELATRLEEAGPAEGETHELTLSTGVRLHFRAIPVGAVRRLSLQYPEPEVPRQFLEEKGREEPNPLHPDYLQAKRDRDETLMLAYFDLALLISAVVDFVPDDFPGIESDEWVEQLDAAGIIVPRENVSRRRLTWLKLYAAPTPNDLARMGAAAMARSGLAESEVSRAASSFLRLSQWADDQRAPTVERTPDGDRF